MVGPGAITWGIETDFSTATAADVEFAATGSAGTGVDVDATAICPDAGAATDGSTGTGVGSDVTTEAGVGVGTDWEH